MRKITFLMTVALLMLNIYNASAVFKIFGIEISYEKGTKEWNAAHTATECVGKGCCKITVKGNAGLVYTPGGNGVGVLGFYEDGKFGMKIPLSVVNDRYWSETFANRSFYIGKDIELSSDITNKIPNCPKVIKAGSYRYEIEGANAFVVFN